MAHSALGPRKRFLLVTPSPSLEDDLLRPSPAHEAQGVAGYPEGRPGLLYVSPRPVSSAKTEVSESAFRLVVCMRIR